jgi:hypothetical protein
VHFQLMKKNGIKKFVGESILQTHRIWCAIWSTATNYNQ